MNLAIVEALAVGALNTLHSFLMVLKPGVSATFDKVAVALRDTLDMAYPKA